MLRQAYDNAMLDALERALKEVLQVLAAHDPNFDKEASAIEILLVKKLMSLADSGISDPHELRNKTLESLPLNPLN